MTKAGLVMLMLIAVQCNASQTERYYQLKYCKGQTEVVLSDKTRVDCLTKYYAIEYDFARKWAEAIGQSLHYASMTDKLPGIALIIESQADCRHYTRLLNAIRHYQLSITVNTINMDC